MLLTPPVGSTEIMLTDSKRYDSLIGGIQIGPCKKVKDPRNGDEGFLNGTLGLIVINRATGNRAILSNHHVLYGLPVYGLPPGLLVSQPAPTQEPPSGQPYPNVCAQVTSGAYGTYNYNGIPYHIDAAIADLTRDDVFGNTRRSSSRINGKYIVPGTATAKVGARVWKVGAETGLTYGTVASLNVDLSVLGIDKPNRMLIGGENNIPFAAYGDSGAVVVDDDSRCVVGLLTGGFSAEEVSKFPGLQSAAFACHIRPVVNQLHIDLDQLAVG